MATLLLIMLLIVIGSKVVYKDNFAEVQGTVNLTASSDPGSTYLPTNFSIDYPNGFSKENTVVVGFKCKLQGTGTGDYIFGYTPDKMSASAVSGAYPRTVRMSNKLECSIYNLSSSRKLDYVIYLMKM